MFNGGHLRGDAGCSECDGSSVLGGNGTVSTSPEFRLTRLLGHYGAAGHGVKTLTVNSVQYLIMFINLHAKIPGLEP